MLFPISKTSSSDQHLPSIYVPPQFLDVESHLGHERAIVVRSNAAVAVISLYLLRLHPLVKHRLGVLHRPVAVNGRVDVHVLGIFDLLLVLFVQELLTEARLKFYDKSFLLLHLINFLTVLIKFLPFRPLGSFAVGKPRPTYPDQSLLEKRDVGSNRGRRRRYRIPRKRVRWPRDRWIPEPRFVAFRPSERGTT